MEKEQKNAKAMKYAAECLEETKIDKEKAKKIDDAELSGITDDTDCYVKCFFKKVGFFNEADELQKDVMIKKLAVDEGVKNVKLEELVEKCSLETAENKCQLAYNIYHCYRTQKAAAIKA